jgi:hypothetical protein
MLLGLIKNGGHYNDTIWLQFGLLINYTAGLTKTQTQSITKGSSLAHWFSNDWTFSKHFWNCILHVGQTFDGLSVRHQMRKSFLFELFIY